MADGDEGNEGRIGASAFNREDTGARIRALTSWPDASAEEELVAHLHFDEKSAGQSIGAHWIGVEVGIVPVGVEAIGTHV